MSSEAREQAYEGGQPVMFFRFVRGSVAWRYTSSDWPEVHNGDIYYPAAISRDRVRQGIEDAQLAVRVTLPASLEVAGNWRPYPPAQPVVLTIFVRHVGQEDVLADWVGRVVAPKFTGVTLELTCEPSSTGAARDGNLRAWTRGCDVPLYSQGLGMCNLDPEDHAEDATVTAVSGLTVTAAEFALFPDGRLAGGYLKWVRESDGLEQILSIVAHTGNQVQLYYGATDLAPDLEVRAYPGCAHTWADCGWFDNRPNYAGELWMPEKTPFDGNPVW